MNKSSLVKGLGVRIVFQTNNFEAEMALSERAMFIPTDEAVQKLLTGPMQGHAFISYD
jgi:hypothetical protein